MLRTDVVKEVKRLFVDCGLSEDEEVEFSTPVNEMLIRLVEELGYDMEIRFVRNPDLEVRVEESKPSYRDRRAWYFKQYLYKMTFPNGMVYIGTAFDLDKRWANNGVGYKGQKVWSAIQEFGWENIKKEVLLYIPHDDTTGSDGTQKIRDRERALIKEYDGRNYNVQCTKAGGEMISQKTRESGAYKIKNYWTVDGVTKPAKDWCEEYKMGYGQVKARMGWGLSAKQALTFPKVPRGREHDPLEYWREQGCFDECV